MVSDDIRDVEFVCHLEKCKGACCVEGDLGAPLEDNELEEMKKHAGSYEALFSRIARKYKEINLASKQLTETDYKNFILEEYTFLKRPVIFIGNKMFVGNAKAVIADVKTELG